MADNQDMFYEDEMPEQDTERQEALARSAREDLMPAEEDSESEELNDMEFYLQMLEKFAQIVRNAKRMPGGYALFKLEDMRAVSEDLYRNLPDAIQYGLNMYNQRSRLLSKAKAAGEARYSEATLRADRVLAQAKEQAAAIITDADDRAKRMLEQARRESAMLVDREEVIRMAQDKAESIVSTARVKAREIRDAASYEMNGQLRDAEEALASAMDALRKGRARIGKDQGPRK